MGAIDRSEPALFEVSSPLTSFLFDGPYRLSVPPREITFDTPPDAQRFLMIKEDAAAAGPPKQPSIIFVQNWCHELKRLVPAE